MIDTIKFEYNKLNIANNKLLINFYDALINYNISRIFLNHVNFKQYEFSEKNFLAIIKDNKKLKNLLRKKNVGKKI